MFNKKGSLIVREKPGNTTLSVRIRPSVAPDVSYQGYALQPGDWFIADVGNGEKYSNHLFLCIYGKVVNVMDPSETWTGGTEMFKIKRVLRKVDLVGL